MVKILLLATHLNTGGITRYLLTLVKGLQRSGHEVWIATSGGDREADFVELGRGIVLLKVDIKTKSEASWKLIAAFPQLKHIIQQVSIDIIHANTRVTQILAWWLSLFTRRPFVSTCHGFFKTRWFRRLVPAWGRAVIAISDPVRDHLINDFKVKPANVRLIPNGVDSAEFYPLPFSEKTHLKEQFKVSGHPVVGIIARLSVVKGIDVLLRAGATLVKKHSQLRLLIVGVGPEEAELRKLTEELQITAAVTFLPVVNRTVELLNLMDIFVLPSRQEGLGLSVLEAQAVGLPVVASKVGGLASLLQDGQTGLLVPPENPELLARAIGYLIDQPEYAARIAEAGRVHVQEHFAADRMVQTTIELYQEMLGS